MPAVRPASFIVHESNGIECHGSVDCLRLVVDQTDRSSVREEFSRVVHGKSAAAVKSTWNQQIFSGRDVPPVEKSSDGDVVAFVRATPGAVGYVSDGANTEGLHVIPQL
jgi:ABC-type phosphate transport system substrate-binding protein